MQREIIKHNGTKYIYKYIYIYINKCCQAQPSSHSRPKAFRAEELEVSSLGIIIIAS